MGFEYEIIPPTYEEVIENEQNYIDQVMEFAKGKALSVIELFDGSDDVLVIGFDSMVEVDGKALGKPKTKKAAFEMFQSYRDGKRQGVATGVCIAGYQKGKYFESTAYEESFIWFRKETTNCQLRSLLDFNEWKGRAGGYSVQGPALFVMERLEGDFQNIVGVPFLKLGSMIRETLGKEPIKIFSPKK